MWPFLPWQCWLTESLQHQRIEAETKWPSIFWHFQMRFHEWKCIHFDYDFTENSRPQWYWICGITATLFHTKTYKKYNFIIAEIHSVSQWYKESVILHNRGNRQCIRFALTMPVNKYVSLSLILHKMGIVSCFCHLEKILLDMCVS